MPNNSEFILTVNQVETGENRTIEKEAIQIALLSLSFGLLIAKGMVGFS